MSANGHIILPKNVRDSHAWVAGSRYSVEEVEGGVQLRPLSPFPPSTLEEVAGILKREGAKPATIQQMDAAIAKAIRRRHESGRY
jgi:hypothetical protein